MARYYYGGQAVVEGVMMRGRRTAAVAVRVPAGGILVHEEALNPRVYASRIAQLPFIRGVILLWDMLVLGTRMLLFAANVAVQEPTAETELVGAPASVTAVTAPPGTVTEAPPAMEKAIGGAGLAFAMLLSVAFAVGLFFLAPLAVAGALRQWIGDGLLNLLVEGVVRLAILVGYLWFIGRLPSVKRVFEYHGAEHKAINTFESGQPLDVEHVRAASKVHTRCGTGFLLIVVVISIVVFALVGNPPLVLRVASRILLVPVIAAIAYELMRLGAGNYRFRVVRWLMAPSLALQGLTTRQPDNGQIECAIVALGRVLRADGVAALERVA